MNTIDIKVVTDYTEFTNAVRFELAVPVASDDAKTIYKDLNGGDWSKAQTDITAAIKKTAPSQIATVVQQLLDAYNGKSATGADSTTTDTSNADQTQGQQDGGG